MPISSNVFGPSLIGLPDGAGETEAGAADGALGGWDGFIGAADDALAGTEEFDAAADEALGGCDDECSKGGL
jgi:hypothetical protein